MENLYRYISTFFFWDKHPEIPAIFLGFTDASTGCQVIGLGLAGGLDGHLSEARWAS